MAEEKDVAVVETSTVNPKQAVNVLENIDKVSALNTPTQTLQNNSALFKQEENTNFFNSDAWGDYKSDVLRAYNSNRYAGFPSIEATAGNPAYTTIIDRYGDAVAKRAQALHSTYARANNWFSRLGDAYNTHRYGLRAAAARKDLSNAILNGDEAEIARAKMRYQSEQRKVYEEGYGYEEYGDTLMSLLASTARNPETLVVEGAGAVFAPATGGASLLAANALNAGIIGADTYRTETGGALQELDEEAAQLTEEQKFEKARTAGIINAAVEAGLVGIGGNVMGRGLKTLGKEAAVQATMKAVKKKTGEEITRDAAKDLIKTDFLKALQKPASEKTFRDTVGKVMKEAGINFVGEGGQEVFQNTVTDAMLRSVKNGTELSEELLDDWADFIANPFSEKHADKWETFVNVGAASLILGGGFQGGAYGIRKLGEFKKGDTSHKGMGTIQDKALGAYNNTLGLSKLFSWHKDNDAKNAVGASNAVLEDQIKRGEASGKLYTTVEQVQEMQRDPEVAAALEDMGIAKSLSEASDNGGVVEIDLLAYDKVVNESQNEVLFQKMRNYLSFSDTTMSLNEFNQFINNKGKEVATLITDEVKNDQESIYNKLKDMAIKAGRDADRAEGYAVLGHILLNNMKALTNGKRNDILDRLNIIINNGQGTVAQMLGAEKVTKGQQTLFQKIKYKGKEKDMFNDVFTSSGKKVKYAEFDSDFNTGVNREAIKDDTNIKIIKMSPQQFLSMTPKKMGNKDVKGLEDAINNGKEIAMPFLDVEVVDPENKVLSITGHEGRHRSLAMQNLGVENGYVILNSKDFYRQPSLFANGLKGWKLLPQKETDVSKAIELDGDARDNEADVPVGEMFDEVFAEGDAYARDLHVVRFATAPSEVEAGRTTAQDGKYNIILTPEANAVTFAHELFHVFSLELQRVYNDGTITDFWKAQAEKMFKIAGAEPMVDPVDPTVVRYNLTESQEEHLANMFTTYIMKGKIENYEVRGLLSKLIDLFQKTYRQLDGAGLTPMALNAKAYEFFNTVMSSQEFVEEIQRDAGLLEIAQPEGVDRELYDYYIANLAASKVEAASDLRRKWYLIDTFKKSPEYTKKMQEFKDQAKAELLEEDRYKILAQAGLFEGENKEQETYVWAQNNMPEQNYSLGDITDILENTPPLEEASTKAADEEMEKYLAKRFNITPQDIGFREERNRAKVRALLAESVMQRGGTLADIENEIKKAEAASDRLLSKTSVYQIINLDKWKNREIAAVERYSWARQQNRKDLMSAERYNQAVLNLIMIKSSGYKSEYQKLSALFQKLQARQRKYKRKDAFGKEYGPLEHRYHAEDWELLRSISENFGNPIRDRRRSLKTVHEQMKDWIKTQVENRFSAVAGLEEFLPFIDKGTDGSIGAMKGKDFKKLWAVMHTIDSIAMREQQLYLDGQYEEMNQYVADTLEFHKKMDIKTDEDKSGWYNRFFGKYGTWTNPEPLLRAIFPPKVFQKIFLPMFQGATLSEAVAKKWIDTWNQAKAKINTSNEAFVLDDGSQITYGDKTQKTMTYGDVANLLIAMGSEHSYENYKIKFGLTDKQAEQIASQAIKRNPAYVEFMNTTWSVYGEATEKLNTSYQERTNELFVRKEHRAFEIDGIKFEGGYVPEDKHYLALVRELGTWNQGMRNKVENKNEKLITKLADGNILSIIDITETKLSQSAKWIYAATPYNNIKKFIEREEISEVMGDRAFNFIKDWLQNWDTPHFDESGVWRPLTRVTTIAALGVRASTALLQLSGLVQSCTHLGRVYLGRGMLQFVREGGFFKPFALPASKSVYMSTRVENPFASRFGADKQGRSIKDILKNYDAKTKLGKVGYATWSMFQSAAMSWIQIVDGWVATITWNGAYAKALDQGMTKEEASAEADSAVRITQSDATQISRSSAMQESYARAVTAFATWTMAMRSQVVALTSSKKYRKDLALWIASYALLSTFIEAFLKDLVEPADEGDDDKEMLERVMNSWYNKIVEAVGAQVMPFAGTGTELTKRLAAGLVNTDDDKIFKVYAGGNVAALQYASRVAQAAEQSLNYMLGGDEEDGEKLLIQASGLVSYEVKKYVKKALED